jgi:dipeptidyl aminopeptidase/acylaminoacyl peptidase
LRALRSGLLPVLAGTLLVFSLVASACSAQVGRAPASGLETSPAQTSAPQVSGLAVTTIVSPTATLAPSPTTNPTATALPTPTPAPVLRQLTSGGCCVGPFWSPDSQQVLYIDKPSQDAQAGIWGVGLQGGVPELFTDRLGLYSDDLSLLAYPQGGRTVVERLADGTRWSIANGGRPISFSADDTQIAWTGGQSGPPNDTARRQVWVSQVDGSQTHMVLEVFGGGFVSWLPDGRMLVDGRLDVSEPGEAFWIYDPQNPDPGAMRELARADRLRGVLLSPGGSWLAYQVAFASDPAEDGLWLVNTASGQRTRLDLFGAYRWRDDSHLLVIPLDTSATWHSLWEVDAASGVHKALTDPQVTPFKVADGDWSVSPDGRYIAFVSAQDFNIWLMTLPQN